MQMLGKADVIAPICTVLCLLQMPTMPTMRVYGKELVSATDILMATLFTTYL